MINYLLKKEN